MCLEISFGTCPTVFSCGGISTIALLTQQYGSIFFDSLFVSIFTLTKSHCLALLHANYFVNVISTSSYFCLKIVGNFCFLNETLHKLLLQKFRMECFVQLNPIVDYTTMYLLRVLFFDGREHTQQFKYIRFLFVFINKGKSMALLD